MIDICFKDLAAQTRRLTLALQLQETQVDAIDQPGPVRGIFCFKAQFFE